MEYQVKHLKRTLVKERTHFSLKTANNVNVALGGFFLHLNLNSSFSILLQSTATVFSFQKIYK